MKARYLLLAVAVLTVPPGSALARSDRLREQSREVVDSKGLTGVRVENPRGLIQIIPSQDGRIHVTALKLVVGHPSSRAQDFARETRVETSTEGGRYVIRVHYPQRQVFHTTLSQLFRGEFDLPRTEVRLSLEVPPRLTVDLSSTSGDLDVSGMAGPQTLASTSGDIEVHGVTGRLTVRTTSGNVMASGLGRASVHSVSGDIALDDARGPLDLRTTSGEVEVSGVADSVGIVTVSGDMRVTGAPRGLSVSSTSGSLTVDGPVSGTVRVAATSGDVRLALGPAVRGANVGTVSGEITVDLAPELGCDLSLTSTSGTLDSSVPIRVRTMTRRELSGTVGRGGGGVSLHSVSGDITVAVGGK